MTHLCIGCGICAAACQAGRISMPFDARLGVFQPSETRASCEKACGACERACPFVPDNPLTSDITHGLFGSIDKIRHDPVLGYYLSTQVGYSFERRRTSASGGLATWILETLLDSGEVDQVICVGPDEQAPTLFRFRVCTSAGEIRTCSGSCYQPVEMSEALRYVLENDGRYAVTALPCMARALRLAMRANSCLEVRIRYVIGLTCGQMKSRHFVDYIAERYAGRTKPAAVQFRSKRAGRPASDFAFRFVFPKPDGQPDTVDVGRSDGIGGVWSNRWFTPEACDYCDDVFAECADATFMDAWLPDYAEDWRGHTLVVIRNPKIEALFAHGMAAGTIQCEPIPPTRALESQKGVVFQKRIMAGCHYEAASASLPILAPRHAPLTLAHRKAAFIKRNVRRLLQEGPSRRALRKVAWFSSPCGACWAALYVRLCQWRRATLKRKARKSH